MSDGLFQPLTQGDVADDDSDVIESIGAHPVANPGKPPVDPDLNIRYEELPPIPTRLVSGTISMLAAASPQRILPPDPNRKTLHIDVQLTAVTDYIYVADDDDLVPGIQLSFKLYSTRAKDIVGHTGPIYVGSPSTDCVVTWFAVTGGKA